MNRAQYRDAMKAKTTHSLRASGYYRVGAPDVAPAPGVKAGRMGDTRKLVDGSWHVLQPPNGCAPMRGAWNAAEQAWEVPGGVRMAYAHAYMDRHGWTYVGPAPAEA